MQKILFSSIVLLAVVVMSARAGVPGGLGESRPVDSDVNELVDRLRSDIIRKICDTVEGKCPSSDAKITVNNYKTQVVAGTNYFVGVTIEDVTYHLRIFSQPWTQTETVANVQGPKQLGDEISYF